MADDNENDIQEDEPSFAELLEAYEGRSQDSLRVGDKVSVRIIAIGKDAVFDLAVFTIRLSKSVISVGLAVGLLHRLSLEIHSAYILSYDTHLSRAACRPRKSGNKPINNRLTRDKERVACPSEITQ
mgnify:CR=1 FL=1